MVETIKLCIKKTWDVTPVTYGRTEDETAIDLESCRFQRKQTFSLLSNIGFIQDKIEDIFQTLNHFCHLTIWQRIVNLLKRRLLTAFSSFHILFSLLRILRQIFPNIWTIGTNQWKKLMRKLATFDLIFIRPHSAMKDFLWKHWFLRLFFKVFQLLVVLYSFSKTKRQADDSTKL